jgi:3-deoxy-manno-octulosonate cytidylyltransferase (CMP-KDO synthetase)
MTAFTVIIPARFGASRLPGKPMLDLVGKPVIQHVIDRALESGATRVVVATDDTRIEQSAIDGGAQAVLTRADHQSGTDRIAQTAQILSLPDDEIIINVQGDEPDMPPELIRQMADALADNTAVTMCTACTPITSTDVIHDPGVVKVVRDKNNFALYFSRAPIAFDRDGLGEFAYRRHLGIYAYRANYLVEFSSTKACALEQTEKLEQLRVLYRGDKLYCPDAIKSPGIGIDTETDIKRARAEWAGKA